MSDATARPTATSLTRWTVTTGSSVGSHAAVVIHAGGHDWKASAEGNGAVDALYQAVDRALSDVLGGHPRLLAYDVHALAEGPDAQGRVTVSIAPPASAEGARGSGRFSGEVTSTNIVAASVDAYLEALNAMLGDESWAGVAEEAGSRGRDRSHSAETADEAGTSYDEADAPIDTTEWFNR
jgi:LeuA allosteric (dimerisation) domain